MEIQSNGVCQWLHCDARAAKHVWYGLRVRDAASSTPLSETSYTTENQTLCKKHVAEVARQYVHVTEFELE
jgi:hypothetical protein